MATNQDIIAAVKTRLDTIANIGATHAYRRWGNSWSQYLDQFQTTIGGTTQIRGWVVTLSDASPISSEDHAMHKALRTYNVLVYGFLGLDDSANTEQTFLNLVEAIMDDLDARRDFGVGAVVDFSVGYCQFQRYDIRAVGSTLCHYGEILVPVWGVTEITHA